MQHPEQVQALFKRTIGIGASFGVIEVLGPRDEQGQWLKVQVATFRCDGSYSDERRPDSVTFSSPREDAERRDFTINGMFRDPIANRVIGLRRRGSGLESQGAAGHRRAGETLRGG